MIAAESENMQIMPHILLLVTLLGELTPTKPVSQGTPCLLSFSF